MCEVTSSYPPPGSLREAFVCVAADDLDAFISRHFFSRSTTGVRMVADAVELPELGYQYNETVGVGSFAV
jgi:hypothetical protein